MTKIEWAEETLNPHTGCTEISTGCKHCYARDFSHRLANNMKMEKYQGVTEEKNGRIAWTGKIRFHPDVLDKLYQWKRPRKVFLNSMSDTFHEDIPFHEIDQIMKAIRDNPQHIVMVLTKRPDRAYWYFHRHYLLDVPIQNLWLGTTIENQDAAEARLSWLLETEGPGKKFLSCEPLVGPVSLYKVFFSDPGTLQKEIDWVIVGGESGKGCRPMQKEWAVSLWMQARQMGAAFFFKQWGGNKKINGSKGGNTLDGLVYQEFPSTESA